MDGGAWQAIVRGVAKSWTHFHYMLRLTLSRLYYIVKMVSNIYETLIKISAGML